MKTVNIDTGEIDTYGLNWSVRLPSGDTIAASTWTGPDGIDVTITDLSFSGAITSFEADATDAEATARGAEHVIVNEITTTNGLTLQGGLKLRVTDDV